MHTAKNWGFLMMNKVEPNILDRLLKIDHESIACKLGLTDRAPTLIDEPLLLECLHLVDDLSRKTTRIARM
jgi:hypothetical protein